MGTTVAANREDGTEEQNLDSVEALRQALGECQEQLKRTEELLRQSGQDNSPKS